MALTQYAPESLLRWPVAVRRIVALAIYAKTLRVEEQREVNSGTRKKKELKKRNKKRRATKTTGTLVGSNGSFSASAKNTRKRNPRQR